MKIWLPATTSIALAAATLHAQSPPPAPQPAELLQWTQMYWTINENGVPAEGAGEFQFGDARLNNTPGVFPIARALMGFRDLYLKDLSVSGSPCDSADIFEALDASPDLQAKFKEYTISTTYSTDLSDAPLTLDHVNAAIGTTGEFLFEGWIDVVDQKLQSSGLKIRSDLGTPDAIPDALAPQIVKDFGDSVRSIAAYVRDTGMEEQPVAQWLINGRGVSNGSAPFYSGLLAGAFPDAKAQTVAVLFGDTGMLFATRLFYGGYSYLADASLGAVYGPYPDGADVSAKEMLVAHPELFSSNMTSRVVAVSKCVPVAVSWPRLPPAGLPPGPPVPCPCPSTPPAWPVCCIPAVPPGAPGWVPGPWTPTVPCVAPNWCPPGTGYGCWSTGVLAPTCFCVRTTTISRCTRRWFGVCVSHQYAVVTEHCSWTPAAGPCGGLPPAGACYTDYILYP